jgi:hypothetical protein
VFSNLSIRDSITSRGTIKKTVRGYPGHEQSRFEIEICFRGGKTQKPTIRVVSGPGSEGNGAKPPQRVLDRIVRLVTAGDDLDSATAFVTAALPDPLYSRDKDLRAAITAIIYNMELERSEITRAIGRAFEDERVLDRP